MVSPNPPSHSLGLPSAIIFHLLKKSRTSWLPCKRHPKSYPFIKGSPCTAEESDHGLAAIHYALAKADAFFNADWIAGRASCGLNGA